jgi:hypothetical protein
MSGTKPQSISELLRLAAANNLKVDTSMPEYVAPMTITPTSSASPQSVQTPSGNNFKKDIDKKIIEQNFKITPMLISGTPRNRLDKFDEKIKMSPSAVDNRPERFIIASGVDCKIDDFGFLHEWFEMKTYHVAMKNKSIDELLEKCDLFIFQLKREDDNKYYQQYSQTFVSSKYKIICAYIHPSGKKIKDMTHIKKSLNCHFVFKRIAVENIKDRTTAISIIFRDHISSSNLKKNSKIDKTKKYLPSI